MFNRLISWFLPERQNIESADDFKLKAIILISLLVGNSGFPFVVLFFYIKQPRVAFVVLWSWVIFMCIPFLARNKVTASSLAHILAANYFQCHFFICLIWGGMDAPNTMWFTAIPIVSVLVGGISHGLIWSGISGSSILSIYLLERYQYIELNSNLDSSTQVFVLAMGAVGLLVAIFGSTAVFEMLRLEAVRDRIRAEEASILAYQRTESLLLNILPISIAKRLITQPGTIADDFENASVLFADIVGFTSLASTISANETVTLLNEIFSSFDHLVDQHELEKIKTVGDAYMVAGGIPIESENHLPKIILLAQQMLTVIETYNDSNGHNLTLRIGIAAGPITAGVIGARKFNYDIWGDTVNVASRMESTGIPGRIQVTQRVAEDTKNQFTFEERGVRDIKGKGMMPTYLLSSKTT